MKKNIVSSLINKAGLYDDGEDGVAVESNLERLVELTVLECLKVLEMKEHRPRTNRHWDAIGREVSFIVKDHFGVE